MTNKVPPISPPPSNPEARTPININTNWGCPRCGSTDLASTYLVDYSDKFDNIYLAPKGLSLRRLNGWLLRPFRRLTKVYADTCRNCGMVVLEVNTDELAEAEKRYGKR